MKKKYIIIASLSLFFGSLYGQIPKGIYKDSSVFKSWATGISMERGWVNISDTSIKDKGTNKASFGYPAAALGKAGVSTLDVVSLGDGGKATLTFDRPISNGPDADFAVFENGMKMSGDSIFSELAFVEVSSDGSHFVRFPAISKTQTSKQVGSYSPIWSDNVTNMAGNLLQGYGTGFNLDDIADSANIDIQNIKYVRIIDAVGSIDNKYATKDSKGNKVNDPFPTPFWSSGFDLDAVGVINAGQPYAVSTFESFAINADSYFMPSATDTAFINGLATFSTENSGYGVNAFTYSTMRDDSTGAYTNGYSAITAGGVSAPDTGGTHYAIAYVTDWGQASLISFTDKKAHKVNGMYVTNATYPYLSMKNGDAIAKKFGGASGNDADWFKLQIWGIKNDNSHTDTIDFYLADFRFSDNKKDYIVNSWQWIDLQKFGEVKSIGFGMLSSDVGTFGMNTPSYFCLDNLTVLPADAATSVSNLTSTIIKNSATQTIDINHLFSAYNSAALSYIIKSNSNPDLVTAVLNSNKMEYTITEDSVGTAVIVIEASANGTKATSTITINVKNNIVSISEITTGINVYPNPCADQIFIKASKGSGINLFDSMGHEIINSVAENEINTISTKSLPKGIYIIQITEQKDIQSFTIIKN